MNNKIIMDIITIYQQVKNDFVNISEDEVEEIRNRFVDNKKQQMSGDDKANYVFEDEQDDYMDEDEEND